MSNYNGTLDMEENTLGGSLDMVIGIPGPKGDPGEPGKQGIQGEPGAGIADITQYFATSPDIYHDPFTEFTTERPLLSAQNKALWTYFEITYTDGSVQMTNRYIAGAYGDRGEKGDPGKQGDPGKSAFKFAQEGGYVGAETDFNSDLAAVGGLAAALADL